MRSKNITGKPIFLFVAISCISFLILFYSVTPALGAEWQKKSRDYSLVKQHFEQPPLWFAPHAFWFWDAPIDPAQTASMAGEMTKQRLNPGYAHARHSGAPTSSYPKLPVEQWLSPLWFRGFAAALHEAEKAEMTLGYCDEYWWPSGQAAGRVLQAHPELQAQSLKWRRQTVSGPTTAQIPKSFFSVAAQLNKDGRIIAGTLKLIGQGDSFFWQAPAGNWVIYSYTLYFHPGYDGGKVNYLNPKLMDVFIDIAHKPYEQHFASKMGKSIPGVFVDNEGDYGWKLAWSDYFAEQYRQTKGRDIRLWMPLLTEKDEEGLWAKARYDWFEVVSTVYTKVFLAKLNDWLAQHGMYYISNLWEESLQLQSMAVGDFMQAQRTVSLPGNDCLQMKSQQVHDFKETQSVCEFEGKPFMSELMGVAGWEQTPVQMKMTLNSVTAFGVTHNVPHGINLNRNLATIPYPADWFTENPYWRYLHLWTDFARRAAFVNQQGRLVADILLYNPLESVWVLSEEYFNDPNGKTWSKKANHINEVYSRAMNVLTASHQDYLIADRYYMKKATVTVSPRPVLAIGEHKFSALVLPPMLIVPRSTAQKILDFARAGGVVVLLGELPKGSPEKGATDSLICRQMAELLTLQSVINLADDGRKMQTLAQVLREKVKPQIRILSGDIPLFLAHRKIGQADFYWIANNENSERQCQFLLRDGIGRAEIWNCETGAIRPIAYEKRSDGCLLQVTIKPYEAFWLVFNPAEKPLPPQSKVRLTAEKEIEIAGPWTLSLPETNRVPVSSARMIFEEQKRINKNYVKPDYDDSSWQFQNIIGPVRILDKWRAKVIYIPDPFCTRYFRYTFTLSAQPVQGFLNINADNSLRLWINGQGIAPGNYAETWANTDLHDISRYLKRGKNVIAVEVKNNPGYGWLIAQGTVSMENGGTFEILTGPDWKQSATEIKGWQHPYFDDADWTGAQLAADDFATREFRNVLGPHKVLTAESTLWWRLHVPPGAQKLTLPGLSKNANIWIDAVKIRWSKDAINLPAGTGIIVIQSPCKDGGLSAPAEFICQGSSIAHLGSWLDLGLQRFTGFVDYSTSFELDDANGPISLNLGRVLHMAEVWVNDHKVGERLWPPFSFDISSACRTGVNSLRIRVGNLMVNRMALYDDLGELRHWGWEGRPPDSTFECGLFGPVTLAITQNR